MPMAQRGLTIIVEIIPGKESSLKDLLNTIGDDISDNGIIDFAGLHTVHFMRWVVLEANEAHGKPTPPQLVLSTNFDGPGRAHLLELAREAGQGLDLIYQNCKGYPGPADPNQVVRYLWAHRNRNAAFYRGNPGRSVEQVDKEDELRIAIQDYLQERNPGQDWSDIELHALRYEITREILGRPEFAWAKRIAPRTLLQILGAPLLGLGLLLFLALLALPWFWSPWLGGALLLLGLGGIVLWWRSLRRHEVRDAEAFRPLQIDPERFLDLKQREDHKVQNQITHLVEIKPGLIRQVTLRFVLWAINLLARTIFNKGSLAGITSIHFARWAIIDRGRRLIFFSNFDGSWESYLGEFVDRANFGLTAVWSNSMGFPPTKKLIHEGAKRSQPFKSWTRQKQIPTQVWYSAYKNATVSNIDNNTRVRNGMARDLNPNKLQNWLLRL